MLGLVNDIQLLDVLKQPIKSFEVRINENWMASLSIDEFAKVFSWMTDVEIIVPLLHIKLEKSFDHKEQQHIYKFIRE